MRYKNERKSVPQVALAQWFAANGNYDAAFAELRESKSAALPAVLQVDPLFEGLRADRRRHQE
jgi:hypothetical protein